MDNKDELIDYYSSLGIRNDSTIENITTSYQSLLRRYTPEVLKSRNKASEFKLMFEAYFVLSDSVRKQRYDRIYSSNDLTSFKLFRNNIKEEIMKPNNEMSNLDFLLNILSGVFS